MESTLKSIAVLKANLDTNKDYLEVFVPFIATLISQKGYDQIVVQALCQDFQEAFGLVVPYHPFIAILERCTKRGLLKRTRHEYYPVNAEIARFQFSAASLARQAQIDGLLSSFVLFALNQFKMTITISEASDGLVSYLHAFDADLLFANVDASVLPSVKKKKNFYSFSIHGSKTYLSIGRNFTKPL